MSYLKLGNTHIRYESEHNWDRLILSQIIDSRCSYDSPKLIRSVEDLELYFGNSYKDYEYHCELISSGSTLYLYKPIKSKPEKFTDYIDYSNLEHFTIIDNYSDRIPKISDFENLNLKQVGSLTDSEIREYRINRIFSNVSELPEKGLFGGVSYIYTVLEEGNLNDYFYYNDLEDYVRIDKLPQNIRSSEYKSGKFNKDTLRITCKKWDNPRVNEENIPYCYPKYSSENYNLNYPDLSEIGEENKISYIKSIFSNIENIEKGYSTLAFTLDFSKVDSIENGDYIVLPGNKSDKNTILVYDPEKKGLKPIGDNEISGAYDNTIGITGNFSDDIIDNFISEIKNKHGWSLYSSDDTNSIYKIWNTEGVVLDSQFFNIKGLKMIPDFQLTHDIMSVLSEGNERIEFYSKTIGPGDEDIKVNIKKLETYNKERYRIEISRYSYSEIFEGNLYVKEDNDGRIENLERIINDGSKLVSCKIFRKNKNTGETYNIDNPDDGLREGEFFLRRAEIEDYTIEDFYGSLSEMREEFKIKEDFLLIPNKKCFDSDIDLETLLDYSEDKNCQVLIVNNFIDPDYNDYNDYKTNFIENNNRLVYFYDNLLFNGHDRPGYYVFLRGILGQGYLLPVNDVNYNSPVKNPYDDYPEEYKRYKSNYLVFNEHNYYYRELFSHIGDFDYKLTILSRYCQSHVSKVVEREFPKYLGFIYSGDMLSGMTGILNKLQEENSIIKNLYIEYVEQDDYNQTIDIHLHLDVREAADKDISLGIILNFNFT